MAEYRVPPLVRGSGGGGKGGGGSSRVAEEDPNTLRSKNVASIIDLLGEGPIYGLVDGLKSVLLDGVAVQNADNSFNYNGLILMTRQGYPDQSALPGPHNVQTEYAVSKEVRNDAPIVEGFINAEADIVNVKMQLQALSYQDKKTGDLKESKVAMAIDIRNGVNGNWITVVSRTISGKTTSPYQRQWKIRLPAGDSPEWFVRMRRLTEDDRGTNYQDDIYFASMTAITEAKLTYPDSALIGLKADASQFGTSIPERAYHVRGMIIRVPSNYNPITREYTGTWNGTFKQAWTNNPAWILYDLVTNTRYGAKQQQFDKWGLYSIGQYCDELVPDGYGGTEPRFTCNAVITAQEDAYSAIDSMASVFRGMIYWASSEISAVADRPGSVKRTFTRSNIVDDFVRQGTSMKARHSVVLVTWNDPEDSYKKTIEMVTDQDMIEKWGWRQTEITQFGCTSRGQARRAGKWLMYSEKYETETISFKGTSDAMDLRPGDIIRVSDPAVSGVRLGGRVLTEGTSILELDRVDDIDPDGTWDITVTLPSGGAETRRVSSFDGANVTLATPLSATPVRGAVWILSSSEVMPELFRVISLSDPGVEMQPSITAVSHNPDKYALVEEDIPLPERPTSLIPTGKIKPPTALTAVSHTYLEGGRKSQGITVSWTPADDSRVVSHRLEVMGAEDYAWKEIYSGSGVSFTVKNSSAGEWSFRVKSVDGIGASSVWTYLVKDVANQLEPTPPTAINFSIETLAITVKPEGDMVNQLWEVRRSNVPLATANIESNGHLVGVGTQLHDSGLYPLTTYYYYVRGTNAFGVSEWVPAQVATEGTADAYLEMLSEKLNLTELSQDLQTEIGKISGEGSGSVAERIGEVYSRINQAESTLSAADQALRDDLQEIGLSADQLAELVSSEVNRIDSSVAQVNEELNTVEQRLDGRADSLSDDVDAVVQMLEDEADRLDQAVADVAESADDIRVSLEEEAERLDGRVSTVAQEAEDARQQLAQTSTDLTARIDAADQALVSEAFTRQLNDSALSTAISAVTAKASDSLARVSSLERASVERDEIEAIQFHAIEAAKAGASAAVRTEETARVTGDEALAQITTQLSARLGTAEADITTVDQARAAGDSALSSRIGELSAKLDATPQFGSGFEPGTDFDQWVVPSDSTITSVSSDVYLGTRSALLTSTSAGPSSTGTTGGVFAPVPAGATEAFEGYEVVVTAAIKKPSSNAASEIAIAYSTNSQGNSGWQYFSPTTIWTTIEFRYTVPEGSSGSTDYVGIWADTSGTGKGVLIDAVNVRRANAEITEITAAIQEEQQARVSGDEALSSSISNLESNFQGVQSAITSEQQARTNADSALASDISSLQTSLGAAQASITSEAATRLSKDNALATRATSLESRMGSAESDITEESSARASEDEALSNRITSANSRIDEAESSITSEAQTRANADSALASDISTLQSSVGDVQSSVTSEAQTRANADSALASRATSLESRMGTAESDITSEASARASAVDAVTQSIEALNARIDESGGTVVDEATIRATQDAVLGQRLSSVSARVGDAESVISSIQRVTAEATELEAIQFTAIEVTKATSAASIRTEEQVRVTETSALASRATSLESRVGSAESAITSESQTRASADNALTSAINTQKSRVDSANAAITSEATTRASADSALTTGLQQANSRIDDAESAISSEATTRANRDTALTNSLNSAVSRIGDVESGLSTEESTRANADNALSTRINTAQAKANSNAAAIASEQTARADADSALASDIASLSSSVGEATAAVRDQLTSFVAGHSLLGDGSFTLGDLSGWGNTQKVYIRSRTSGASTLYSEAPARNFGVYAEGAEGTTRHVTTSFTEVTEGDVYSCSFWFARISNGNGDIRMSVQWYDETGTLVSWPTMFSESLSDHATNEWVFSGYNDVTVPANAVRGRVVMTLTSDSTTGRAAYTGVKAYRVDALLAEKVDTVQVQLGQDIASVQQSATTNYNNLNGRLSAKWGVVLDNNGYVSGWGQENDGNTSTTIFRTDRFGVAAPGGSAIYPFIIDGGKTIIQRGLLGNISSGILIDEATGESLTTVSGKLKAQFIETNNLDVRSAAKFSGNVFSDNYQSGSKGWAILQNGKVEFNEATIRGNLEVSSVTVNGNSPSGTFRASRADVSWTSTAVDGSTSGDRDGTWDAVTSVSDVPKGAKFDFTLAPDVSFDYTIRTAVGSYSINLQSRVNCSLFANGVKIKDLAQWTWTKDNEPANLPWTTSQRHPNAGGSVWTWNADKYYNSLELRIRVSIDLINRLADSANTAGPVYEFYLDGSNLLTGTLSRLG